MGYESSGSGDFTIRHGKSIDEAVEVLTEDGFDVSIDRDNLYISFSGFRLYGFGAELKHVQEYLNGEFYITGEESEDIWKLIFEDGKVYRQDSEIVFKEKKEIADISELWK